MFSTRQEHPNARTNLSILVIEKSDFEINTTKKLLQQIGLNKVHTSKSLNNAKNLLKKEQYDFIFCEYELAEDSGLELLKYIKKSKIYEPAFIIMTSNSNKETMVDILESMPDDILVKPFNKAVFKSKTDKIISSYQETRSIRTLIADKEYDDAFKLVIDPKFDYLSSNNIHLSSWLEKKKIEIMMLQGRFDSVINHIDLLLENKRFDLENIRTCQILALLKKRHYDDVIIKTEECLKKHSLSIKSYIFKGHAYYGKGLIDESTKCYNKALSLSKKSIKAQRAVSKNFHETGDYENSLEAYKKLIKLTEKSIDKKESDYYGYANAKKESAELILAGDMNNTISEGLEIIKKGQFNFPDSLLLDIHENILEIQSLLSFGLEQKAHEKMNVVKKEFEKEIKTNGSALVNTLITHQQLGNIVEVDKLRTLAKRNPELNISMYSLDKRMNSFKNAECDEKIKIEKLLNKADSLISNNKDQLAIKQLNDALMLSPKSLSIGILLIKTQLQTLEHFYLAPLILKDCYKNYIYFRKFVTSSNEKQEFINFSQKIKKLIFKYKENKGLKFKKKTKEKEIFY